MGFFDFLKPKKEMNAIFDQMNTKFFPKGQKDIDAVTDALIHILNNKISRSEASNIAFKSVAISRISKEFSKERLKQHLSGYCIEHFNEKQIETFHGYLAFLIIADLMFRKTPSDLVREGDTWVIPQ
jgi:hypothetical protein